MTTPVFPDTLPGVSTLQWSPVDQTIATEQPGPRAVRQRSSVAGADATVTWQFTEGEFAIFQEFYKTELLRGHKWFSLILPCALGHLPHIVRMVKHRSMTREGYNFRTVTAQIDVRERRINDIDIDTFITSTLYPIYVSEGIDAVFTVLSGSFADLHTYSENEGIDPAFTVLSGSLNDILHLYSMDAEGVDPAFTVLSGDLRVLLKTYLLYDPEGVDVAFTVLSGYLKSLLIVNTIPFEGVDVSYTVLSGSLAP